MEYNRRLQEELLSVARSGRAANAYLLTGGTKKDRCEIGKMFAKALVRSEVDLIEPAHEKPHLFSVDDVRREINETVYVRPYGGGKKVYLIKDAGLMNEAAENALLKTLEEPPVYVVMILLAEKEDGFLPTILSRAVKMTLSEETAETAGESTVEADAVTEFLRKSGRASSEDVVQLVKTVSGAKGKDGGGTFNRLLPLFDRMLTWYRDVLVTKQGGAALLLPDEAAFIKEDAKTLSFEGVQKILDAISEAKSRLESNVNTEGTMNALFGAVIKNHEKE